ncbi:MAG: putative membrane protein [Halobacteriales archaeon]|jgi:putative membrane protein
MRKFDRFDGVDRLELERRFDDLVRENRFTIAVVFPTVGAVMLYGSAQGWLPAILTYNAMLIMIGVIVMRLPLIAGVLPLTDRRAGISLGVLAAYAYGIELVGVRTGWPYGEFTYGIDLGPMLFGDVPIGLPVFFFPLVLNSYLLGLLLLGKRARSRAIRLSSVLALVMVVDLVLDPGAVAINFWAYETGGFYGVPWSNYGGWLLSGAVAVVLFDIGFVREGLLRRLEEIEFMLDDLVSFVILWGGLNAAYGNWIPVLLAAGLGVGLLWTDRFDFDVSTARIPRFVRRTWRTARR